MMSDTLAQPSSETALVSLMDNTAAGCLTSFHDSLETAQRDCDKEAQHLAALKATLTEMVERKRRQGTEKHALEQRVEALEAECSRVQTCNAQLRRELAAASDLLDSIREPRASCEKNVKATEEAVRSAREGFADHAIAFLDYALLQLQPDQHPSVLLDKVQRLDADVGVARDRVAALRAACLSQKCCASSVQQQQPCRSAVEDEDRRIMDHSGATCGTAETRSPSSASVHALVDEKRRLEGRLEEFSAKCTAAKELRHEATRQKLAERDELREQLRKSTKDAEAMDAAMLTLQQHNNQLLNECGGSLCASCRGPLLGLTGSSGHD